jgi:hypothetical protein
MMTFAKEQKLITSHDREEFHNEVNSYLKEGWNIISRTLSVQASPSPGAPYYIFMVVLERDKPADNRN